MASNINPNNIDTTYPVAGQDNSTQGFRTNFTNIKQNFEYAEQEITALQSNTATTNGANDFGNNLLVNARIQDFSDVKVAHGTTTGALEINYASGSYHTLITSGSVSITFSNWPAASPSAVGTLRLQVEVTSTTHTLTIAADNSTFAGLLLDVAGIQGYTAVNAYTGTITFANVGYYEFEFLSSDGGKEITVTQVNQSLTPLNASSEDLAPSTAASLGVTTSYFSTAAAETATLAAGVNGQIKVFAMKADSGDMVITVTNAGWKTSGTGTITFDTIGDACTLLYTSGKWFCIGNNGCVFA